VGRGNSGSRERRLIKGDWGEECGRLIGKGKKNKKGQVGGVGKCGGKGGVRN